ncbi:MAG: DNA translocase FtsK [Anaerolineae bacterium]|jgi:S-DNA-T family DNA segregation ATPase FtsK/SpoIIIE
MRQTLESQADQIEAVLARRGIEVRVTGGTTSPRWIQFHVHPATPGAREGRIEGLAGELALALEVETCRVLRQGETVTVQVPRPAPQPVPLLPLQTGLVRRQQLPPGTALLGLTEAGAPLLARLSSPQVAHLLVAGDGGGNNLLRTILASLAQGHRRSQLGLVLIDLERRAFGPLAGLPHLLRPVLSEPGEISRALQSLVRLAAARCNGKRPGAPRIVVAIGELDDLLALTGVNGRVQWTLTQLAECGCEAGVHLVAGTQKPVCGAVERLIRANFPARLVGQAASAQEARAAAGYAGTGAERLRGPDDFVAVTRGQVVPFQAARVTARELAELVSQSLQTERNSCRSQTRVHPRHDGRVAHNKPRRSAFQRAVRAGWLYWTFFKHWFSRRG